MEALKQLYVAVSDDEVVMYETNVSAFVTRLNEMGISDRNYQYFNRKFKVSNKLTVTGNDGCVYNLQKLK